MWTGWEFFWPLFLPKSSLGGPRRTLQPCPVPGGSSAAVPACGSRVSAHGTYLVVALGVEAVVVLAVLVGAVDVATVLTA